jgi:hypothetical protein
MNGERRREGMTINEEQFEEEEANFRNSAMPAIPPNSALYS